MRSGGELLDKCRRGLCPARPEGMNAGRRLWRALLGPDFLFPGSCGARSAVSAYGRDAGEFAILFLRPAMSGTGAGKTVKSWSRSSQFCEIVRPRKSFLRREK